MITTKPFRLSQNEYLKVLVINKFKKKWYILVLLVVVILTNLSGFSENAFARFAVILGLLYIPITIFTHYKWVRSKANENLFVERTLSYDNEFIYAEEADGNSAKVPFSSIIKVTKSEKYILIYYSNVSFSYIPKSAFHTIEDFETFEKAASLHLKEA